MLATDGTFVLTDHARHQMDNRCIGLETVRCVMAHGDRRVQVGGGMVALSLTRRRRDGLRQRGVAPAQIERAAKIILVVRRAEEPVIITVMRGHVGADRHYRRV